MLIHSQRGLRCRVAREYVLAMGRMRVLCTKRSNMPLSYCPVEPLRRRTVGTWQTQMPSSHELGDRSARAGAAPGRVPVRGKTCCGTAPAQAVFVRLRSCVASPGSYIQALARLVWSINRRQVRRTDRDGNRYTNL